MTQEVRRRRAADDNRQKAAKKTKKASKKSKKALNKPSKKTSTETSKKRSSTTKKSICLMCGVSPAHVGDSEESFISLATLDPEAAVFYDRDLATSADVAGLCGPRFRKTLGQGLFAHYGAPQGARYVVYHWKPESKHWTLFGEMSQGRVIEDGTRQPPRDPNVEKDSKRCFDGPEVQR